MSSQLTGPSLAGGLVIGRLVLVPRGMAKSLIGPNEVPARGYQSGAAHGREIAKPR